MTADELTAVLDLHARWLRGAAGGKRANLARANLAGANLAGADLKYAYLTGANLARANLTRANLAGANLAGADFAGANLAGVLGNMREIKSAQFDTWQITWTCAPNGVTTLQIGCQRHALDLWIKSDPRWIAAMDTHAADWWGKYRDVVLALVQASPATPYGAVQQGACVEAVE